MASVRNAGAGAISNKDAVKNLRQNVHSFWHTYGTRFEKWWTGIDAHARRQFISDYTTCMPEAPDSPWGLSPEGTREFVGGSLQLLPELNMKQMVEEPGHLLQLFRDRCQHAEELEQLEKQHGYAMFQGDLEWRDMEYIRQLVDARLLRERSKNDFYVVVGANAGSRYTLKHETVPPGLKMMFDQGAAILADVVDYTLERQSTLLVSLTVLGDGYRQDLQGKHGSKYTATAYGCANCGAQGREGGGKLMLCSTCGHVAYCSKDCQVDHWKSEHRFKCVRPAQAADPGSGKTDAAAAAAAATATGRVAFAARPAAGKGARVQGKVAGGEATAATGRVAFAARPAAGQKGARARGKAVAGGPAEQRELQAVQERVATLHVSGARHSVRSVDLASRAGGGKEPSRAPPKRGADEDAHVPEHTRALYVAAPVAHSRPVPLAAAAGTRGAGKYAPEATARKYLAGPAPVGAYNAGRVPPPDEYADLRLPPVATCCFGRRM